MGSACCFYVVNCQKLLSTHFLPESTKTFVDEHKEITDLLIVCQDSSFLSWYSTHCVPRQLFVNIAPTSRVSVGVDGADPHEAECECGG